MWSSPDVIGLFSNNVVSFSRNVVLGELLFSINLVSKPRMLSVRAVYVLSSLHIAYLFILTIYLAAKKNFWSDVGEDPRSDPALATEIDRTLSLLPRDIS